MSGPANFFSQDFFVNEYKKVAPIAKSATTHTNVEFNTNDILDAIAELSIASLLRKTLEQNHWHIVNQLFMFGGTYPVNQITAVKNSKTLIILLGDGPDKTINTPPDYFITDSVHNFVSGVECIHINPEIYGIYKNIVEQAPVCQPTKLFNCFISAADGYRQCWFYNFVRRGYLQQANISFLLNQFGTAFSDQPTEQKIKFYNENKNFSFNDIFDVEHQLMLNQVPYKNFSGSLNEAILDSKCSIVLETSYAMPGQIYFTEKTFRAIQHPRPFFVVSRQGGPGRISYLRNIGFDVYDDIIDHESYDNVDDPIQQMSQIFDQIKKLQNVEYTPDLLENFEQRAQHNRALIRKFNVDLVKKYQDIVDRIKEIS